MKHFIAISLLPLAALLIVGITLAGYAQQGSWIGGPGVPGPVDYWNIYFDTESDTQWSIVVGKLSLGISVTAHIISGDFPGCHYAFPADMDGDGDMDVLSSQTVVSPYRLAWFENDGTGAGWDMHVISIDYPTPKCAYPGDLDDDGDMDVIVANTSIANRCIEWWRNDDGVGDSWTRFTIDEDFGSPMYVCCADINGDGVLDVVSPSDTDPYQIAWWASSTTPPDSVWEKSIVSSSVRDGEELFTVDLDQDGDMDILCACPASSSVAVQFWRNDDGVGTAWTFIEVNDHPEGAQSVHAADIDGDNDMDVIYSEDVQPPGFVKAYWCENVDGSCTNWEEHEISATLENPRGIHGADVIEDGYVDIIVTDREAHKTYLYRNMDGEGGDWATYLLASTGFYDVDVSDFNDDGHTDILAAGWSKIYWFELSPFSSGWLESSILNVTGYPEWDSVTWVSEEPAGTDLFFQARSSNNPANMGAWCDTIFEPGSLAGLIDSTHRYIQYRVSMTSTSGFITPVLDEVYFYWSNLGIEGGGEYADFTVTTIPNPTAGGITVVIPAVFAEDVEIFVYDISGKLIMELTESDGSVFHWDGCDSSGNELPAGTYVVRGVAGNRFDSVKFVKL